MMGRGGLREVTSGSPLKSVLDRGRWGPMATTSLGLLTAPRELARYLGVAPRDVGRWLHQLRTAPGHGPEVLQQYRRATGARPEDEARVLGPTNEMLYLIVRAVRPQVVVETGVHFGFSTSYLLRGLADNALGKLYSIDLPTTDPSGRVNADGRLDRAHVRNEAETGCAIPDRLRERWELSLGSSDPLLPELLVRLPPIDVFFHDSDHSRSFMLWEYHQAWPKLRPGGYLLSDDIDWNDAFDVFTKEVGGAPFRWFGRNGKRGALHRPAS